MSEHTVVCSRQFKTSDYKRSPVNKTMKPGSLLSVFNWTIVTTPRWDILKLKIPEKRARRDNTEGTIQLKRWTVMTWVFCQGYLVTRGNLKFFKHSIEEVIFPTHTFIHVLHKICIFVYNLALVYIYRLWYMYISTCNIIIYYTWDNRNSYVWNNKVLIKEHFI